jgi:hypothetical protein
MSQEWKRESRIPLRPKKSPNGYTYKESVRVSGQLSYLYDILTFALDNDKWLTLQELTGMMDELRGFYGHQPASISASLRTLRNKFILTIDKRLRDGIDGLYEYKLRYKHSDGELQ